MKLVTTAKTKAYELTYLAPGNMTDSELKTVQETVQGLVKKHKGSMTSEDSWGKKTLAYALRKGGKTHTEAYYLHLVLEFPTDQAPLFERDVHLDNDLIRHLFVEAVLREEPVAKE
ncbi:MAG: 30S ribosomal protein S6 [Candidatus Pacebacteria bacterium GW2011_GWB1_47_8]|nr:MAG: 30S ribosomal protein S6 [Candidatus Pacebacteria bacterium GW2011_GWA1_46_10]KKU84692.1 MAG: 30S ribosomal protein S6 [Candidatus Pacebacteria bacterium GW2011_GWB1_47_8]HCR80861.1 30S ribosomal protein S6 [Candidatus Paceibacterota bacterium]